MESKVFRLSMTKIEHPECKFSDVRHEVDVEVKINTLVIYPREKTANSHYRNQLVFIKERSLSEYVMEKLPIIYHQVKMS
ncbi:hypothetical protein H5410_000672 [Solanum commersonii]|uniref:Uncharacterized protein n=1 Tax=Solanum commersonii TaxID=4109 RepID=A0A9J6AXL7_SOLCO|nr:hypothetical protein H5410_000672 [Solanum commersonii]